MKTGLLGALGALIVGAGWAMAQAPGSTLSPGSAPVVAPAPAPTAGPAGPGGGLVYPTVPTLGTPVDGPRVLPDAGILPVRPAYYASAEYLLWKIENGNYPTVATALSNRLINVEWSNLYFTRLANGEIQSVSSLNDITLVRVLPFSLENTAGFGGGSQTGIGHQNGARFTVGVWTGDDQTQGWETSFFFLTRGGETLAAVPTSNFNQFAVNTGAVEQSLLIVDPVAVVDQQTQQSIQTLTSNPIVIPYSARTSLVTNSSTSLMGADLNSRWMRMQIGSLDFGCLAGVRWIGFRDELSTSSSVSLTSLPNPTVTISSMGNLSLNTYDRIRVWNHFFGGQVGMDMNARFGDCFISTRFKTGVGTMVQYASVASSTTQVGFDGYSGPGGMLSNPTDVGNHTRTRISFVPEFNGKLGYQFTSWLRGHVGYDALYMSGVARAGNLTTTNTTNSNLQVGNTRQQISVAQPSFRFSDTEVFIQGINFGLEANF